jgi:hypothetical protein
MWEVVKGSKFWSLTGSHYVVEKLLEVMINIVLIVLNQVTNFTAVSWQEQVTVW